mgnify:CR=1 FL=1
MKTMVTQAAAVLSMAVGLLHCGNGTGPETIGETLPAKARAVASYTYTLREDTLLLLMPTCECVGENLEKEVVLEGLVMEESNSTFELRTEVYDSVNELGADVSFWLHYSRYGDTKSLKDVWRLDSVSFTSTEMLDSADMLYYEELRTSGVRGAGYEFIGIGTNTITFYMTTPPASFTERYRANWEVYYAPQVDVAFEEVDSQTVILVGNVSGDSVSIWKDAERNRHYRHMPENPELFPEYTHYAIPSEEHCPNTLYPTWFKERFLAANQK